MKKKSIIVVSAVLILVLIIMVVVILFSSIQSLPEKIVNLDFKNVESVALIEYNGSDISSYLLLDEAKMFTEILNSADISEKEVSYDSSDPNYIYCGTPARFKIVTKNEEIDIAVDTLFIAINGHRYECDHSTGKKLSDIYFSSEYFKTNFLVND